MTRSATPSDRAKNLSAIDIQRCAGGVWPGEFAELRKLVWGQEKNLLAEEELFGEDDREGVQFLVYDTVGSPRLIASTCAVAAERSHLGRYTGFAENVLKNTVVSTRSTVHPEYRGLGLFSLLVYLGAREGRVQGRQWVAAFLERGEARERTSFGARDLTQTPPLAVRGRGRNYEVVASALDVNQLMSNCFLHIPASLHPYLREHFFADEVVHEAMSGAHRFYNGSWFKAVGQGALTPWQYYRTLAEMHLYVRWTTRLLGTVIGIADDADLRRHYLEHLQGEIDHERMLENDIAHLGFDVGYVKHHMTPCEDIRAFMSLQESLCSGPRRNPALFLAVPFAAEALTAFLSQEFLQRLANNIASWGVANPDRAMTFITGHIRSDGGTDGHWDAARKILPQYLTGEKELQEFLSIVRLAQRSLDAAFTSWVTKADIFSATAQVRVGEA